MSAKKPDGLGARIYPAHKPKRCISVLFWDGCVWEACPPDALDRGDIWRPEPKPPSNRLIDRANGG